MAGCYHASGLNRRSTSQSRLAPLSPKKARTLEPSSGKDDRTRTAAKIHNQCPQCASLGSTIRSWLTPLVPSWGSDLGQEEPGSASRREDRRPSRRSLLVPEPRACFATRESSR